ncbi:AAA-type ATPase lid domain-containing protein [Gracilibacillus alcaliphilus]|uniref:helix-turn-helix domain-containing protein n=1 Tax=Gracilibacillus alcaliphilus TaxID=1401441 RepID=UPI00195BE1B1|nr:helix-turn-helix domain-containing protein [Gracilibacillus alcaliphilus]MBM7675081.1 transcriptional regulator with PAS, ATPase and Fis domain [Gracilibacillus alcaliphilus]
MNITANIFFKYQDVLERLTVGVIITNKDGLIQFANEEAKSLLKLHELENMSIADVIEEPCMVEVKQLHKHIERVDKIKQTQQSIIIEYAPYLHENGTLQGMMLTFETTDHVQEQERMINNSDLEKEVFQHLLVNYQHEFRVLLPDQTEWLVSEHWQEVNQQTSIYFADLADQQAKDVLKSRREKSQVLLPANSMTAERVQLVSRPLQNNGKLLGCLQYLIIDSSHDTVTELQMMKRLVRKLEKTETIEDIVGSSHMINIAREQAKLYAKMSDSIIIRGDKGTGKQMLAQAIHQQSDRFAHPFIPFFVSKLNEATFIELTQEAKDGTVYLQVDEIPDIERQKELYRFLKETTQVRLLFGTESIWSPREWYLPLYESLQTFQIVLPPLKERLEDLDDLVADIVAQYNRQLQRDIRSVDPQVIDYWKSLEWPGNIAQLQQTLEHIIWQMSITEKVVRIEHIQQEPLDLPAVTADETLSLQAAMDQYEKNYIYEMLKKHQFNKTKTAKALGVSIRNLYYKMEKYQMD